MKTYEISFVMNGDCIGTGVVSVDGDSVDTTAAEESFLKCLRGVEREMIEEAKEEELGNILNGLTDEQEDKLREIHGRGYMGTDDDMPDDYEDWVSELTLEDVKGYLA